MGMVTVCLILFRFLLLVPETGESSSKKKHIQSSIHSSSQLKSTSLLYFISFRMCFQRYQHYFMSVSVSVLCALCSVFRECCIRCFEWCLLIIMCMSMCCALCSVFNDTTVLKWSWRALLRNNFVFKALHIFVGLKIANRGMANSWYCTFKWNEMNRPRQNCPNQNEKLWIERVGRIFHECILLKWNEWTKRG